MNNRLTLAVMGVAAVLILALAAVLVFVVAGDSDPEPATGGPDRTPAASGDNGDNGDAPPAAAGELVIRGTDPLFLDPAVVQDAGSALYIVEIFSGLVRLDRDLTVQPDIAERWDVSDDGRTFTFQLNRRATFHDGRPVTAEDVKYSFERALSPSTASVVAENFLGDIVGARDVARGRTDELEGLRVIDSSTVEITIDEPKQYFLFKLTYPTAYVVDRRQIEANPRRWTRNPNGTGSYRLADWDLGNRIVLEAYENHHLGAPKLKTVRIELSGGSALIDYINDRLDVTGIGLDDLDRIQDPSDPLNAEYQRVERQSINYIGFNTSVPPFDDPKVRQAFAMAVDRQRIAEVVLQDAIPVANGILMQGVPGFTPEDKTYPYDPERARELLEESEYAGDMPSITLAESGAGATVGPTTEAILQYWRDNLGIRVDVQQADAGTFFRDLDQGRYQMFHLGWIMDYPDPENILDLLFHGSSPQNQTRYQNDEIDRMLEEARVEADTERRIELYQEVERILVEEGVWIPMFFDVAHVLVKPYVSGYEVTSAIVERFRYVEVNR
jgi:oligopeptide transport system substrate-binding protein